MVNELGRALVVDDEESVRNLLQRILVEAGYNVVTAANGQEALDKVCQLRVGIVLLDVKMPGISGIEVLRQLIATYPDICVIMATAVDNAQTAVEALKLGAYDYITKPFNRDDVISTLQRAIQKKRIKSESEHRQLELQKRVREQAQHLQEQFVEQVNAFNREHKLIWKLASKEKGGKEALSKLPKELRKPMSSVEEFTDALLKFLGWKQIGTRTSKDIDKGSRQ
ncbi:MAG: sigma-54-dependent transcriptional regulator [Dehalococcoidia bacterium]